MNNSEIKKWLLTQAEEDYRKFASSLLPNVDNVLGVRLPKLRKMAKQIVKNGHKSFIDGYECEYFEEILLQGMVIGELKLPVDEHLQLVKAYVPLIDNWSLCDSFCAGLKFVKNNEYIVWEFLQPYLNSKNEFELRFGVVMLLNYFVTDEWIKCVLDKLFTLNSDKYYAQMGIAWAISVCLMKYFELTYQRLLHTFLPQIILKKSVQKGRESYRLTDEQKTLLKELVIEQCRK